MMRKISALLAAFAFALTTLAPAPADARDRRGYSDRGSHRDYDHRRYRHHRDRDRDNGDAIAAGAVGLILGLAIGSLASQPSEPRVQCRNNYQRCPPPPVRRHYNDERGYEGRYDPRYDDRRYDDGGSAYEDEYGYEPGYYEETPRPQCRERQWDRYANRYVTVDVPC